MMSKKLGEFHINKFKHAFTGGLKFNDLLMYEDTPVQYDRNMFGLAYYSSVCQRRVKHWQES